MTSSRAPNGTNRELANITVLADPSISSLALSKGISATAARPALARAHEH